MSVYPLIIELVILHGINKMYLLMEKQHNRGQDGAGFASIKLNIEPGKRFISRIRSTEKQPIQDVFSKINERINYFKRHFHENFYIELQRHGLDDQELIEQKLISLAFDNNIPLVATNDVCFLEPDMKNAHDVLMCIDAGKTISNPDKPSMTNNHYFKSMSEMRKLFHDIRF